MAEAQFMTELQDFIANDEDGQLAQSDLKLGIIDGQLKYAAVTV